jgi:hypothetical protein
LASLLLGSRWVFSPSAAREKCGDDGPRNEAAVAGATGAPAGDPPWAWGDEASFWKGCAAGRILSVGNS